MDDVRDGRNLLPPLSCAERVMGTFFDTTGQESPSGTANASRSAMDDSTSETISSADNDSPPMSAKSRPPKHKRWVWILVLVVVVLPAALFAGWTAIALRWAYARGERAGYIQKFSQKGWVCKTWEGEIAMVNVPGAAQERFAFTVRDDSIANEITRLMGSHVAITYEQHRGVPGACFGETEYFVTAVSAVR